MEREYCLIEGTIQGKVVFEWDVIGWEVVAKSITFENEYGRSDLRRQNSDFERALFDILEAKLLACFQDDDEMREFWRKAETSEYRGHRRRA